MPGEELVIDLSNYKDRVGSRVAPGRYRVQVEDAEAAESQAKNPMVNLWFRIVGGDFDGQTVTDRLVLTEKSLFRVVGFMQAIGLPTPKKRLKINLRQFVGRTLDIDVEDGDPYNGRVRSEVRGYVRVAKQNADKDSGDDLDGLVAAGEGIGAREVAGGEAPLRPSTPTEGGGIPSTGGGTDTMAGDPRSTDRPESRDQEPRGGTVSQENPWDPADEDSVDLDEIDL